MSQAIIRGLTQQHLKKNPLLNAGYTVRVHQKVKEGDKERVQIFEGLIIKTSGGCGINGSITVRKISEGVGVEKIFPIHAPSITKIDIKKVAKVRRAKLYYMRDLSGKSARLKEQQISQAEQADLLEKGGKASAHKSKKSASAKQVEKTEVKTANPQADSAENEIVVDEAPVEETPATQEVETSAETSEQVEKKEE